MVKNMLPMQETQETWGLILGLGRSLEEEMKAHSSLLALGIPWTEEPGKLQFTKSGTPLKLLSM